MRWVVRSDAMWNRDARERPVAAPQADTQVAV
jgi:hypothetical protein